MMRHWLDGIFWRTISASVPDPSSSESRLDSWKAIAAHLGRGVRTVQRWERDEGLPVHRLAHQKRGTVYARPEELDAWWARRGSELQAKEGSETSGAAPRTNWTRYAVLGSLGAVAVIAAILVSARRHPSASGYTVQRVTSTSGLTMMSSVSPDGRMVTYASDGGQDGATLQIFIHEIGTPNSVQLTHATGTHVAPSFSADGRRILFTRSNGARADLYEVATGGGEPSLLLAEGGIGWLSPDGKWLAHLATGTRFGLHLATAAGAPVRSLSVGILRARMALWSPDSQRLLVIAQPDATTETDFWVVPIDGSPAIATGLLRDLRSRGFNTQWTPFATWISDRSIVFSGRNNEGWSLWRQELDDRFRPIGDPEQLTTGTTLDWWPSFAAGRLVFVSSHPDINLWSLPADTRTGTVTGVLRRITRGAGLTAYPSLSTDGRALAFASDRGGNWDIIVRATDTGTERVVADGADRQMYASITRDGRRVAYGVVVSQPAIDRPIYVADVAGGGPARLLCKDCNGRPRDWFPDGQRLLIERFGRRNTVAVLDATTGTQRDLVISAERSVMDPRISPDGRWVAFAAGGRDRVPAVYAAPIPATGSVPESAWLEVDREGHHPAWSPDGRLVYFASGSGFGSQFIRARRFDPGSGVVARDAVEVYRLEGAMVPALITSGAALVTTGDQIVLTLGDFRGDVWTMELPSKR